MAFVNEKTGPGMSDWQTIDHERNIILLAKGFGGLQPIQLFEMTYENKKINFQGTWDVVQDGTIPKKITWHIEHLNIPDKFEFEKTDMLIMISDALKVHGFSYTPVEEVEVEFLEKTIIFYRAPD